MRSLLLATAVGSSLLIDAACGFKIVDLKSPAQAMSDMGVAKLRIDCPRDENNDCEPPITLSWATPYSHNQHECTEYNTPWFGKHKDFGDVEMGNIIPSDPGVMVYEEIHYIWRYKRSDHFLPSVNASIWSEDQFVAAPCEPVEIPAMESFTIAYVHCKEDPVDNILRCSPETRTSIPVAEYDETNINDKALPPAGKGEVYFRSGIKFKRNSGMRMFPAYKFNTTGFVRALTKAINNDRRKCPPGTVEENCPPEFQIVSDKQVKVLNIDDSNQKKNVLFEVRVPVKDGNAIQGRLLHPYFRYPLAVELVRLQLIPHYDYEPSIHVDSSKAVLLKAKQSVTLLSLVTSGLGIAVVLVIIFSALCVVAGGIAVARKALKNRARSQSLDEKSKHLDEVEVELKRKMKEIMAKEAELKSRMEQLEKQRLKNLKSTTSLAKDLAAAEMEKVQVESAMTMAKAAGDEAALQEATERMLLINVRTANIQKQKDDVSAEVERIQSEQDRVRKELEHDVLKQKELHSRKLEDRLRLRRLRHAHNATVVPV